MFARKPSSLSFPSSSMIDNVATTERIEAHAYGDNGREALNFGQNARAQLVQHPGVSRQVRDPRL